MLTWLKLAVRNLFRNGRRSFFTVLAIGLGFLAVNVLGGFTAYMFTSLQHGYIYGEANGHLTIFRQGFLDKGKLDPTRFLLGEQELLGIRSVLQRHREVLVATPQLQISGLLSNGQVSTIFLAGGRVPSDVAAIAALGSQGTDKVRRFDGSPLSDERTFGIGVSHGLARQLNLQLAARRWRWRPPSAARSTHSTPNWCS